MATNATTPTTVDPNIENLTALYELTNLRLVMLHQRLLEGVTMFYVTVMTLLLILLRIGFAYREAGMCRLKNVQAVLYKYFFELCTSTIIWWLVGYAFAWGTSQSEFLGASQFATDRFNFRTVDFANWSYHWALTMVVSAIVLGPVSERVNLWGIVIYNAFFVGWIYPVLVHWFWPGWLATLGYYD